VLVEKRDIAGAEGEFYGFETLTFAPIARDLVDVALLLQEEREWLDTYHAKVREVLAPQLSGDDLAWLDAACAPL
jgi:Xaa-Pro aminopeptidase